MKNKALERAYNPEDIEKTWYDFWYRKGYFRPEFRATGPAYTVTIPPPNVTGNCTWATRYNTRFTTR